MALEVHNLCFSWGGKATLEGVSLTLPESGMVGLLGPNGAGKTTLISLVAGLLSSSKGEILLQGEAMALGKASLRKSLGFVFQSISLDRFMTVEQNLIYAGGLQGQNSKQAKARIELLCDLFPLAAILKRPAGALSGGQKRLADIARAVIHDPAILILDEPTTALDPSAKAKVWETLKELQTSLGKSVLVATHLMDEAQDCDQVVFLNQGKVHWAGTPEQALAELPDQSLTQVRNVNLADWFVWKLQQTQAD